MSTDPPDTPAVDDAHAAEDDALQDALAAEHVAVWAHGVIGAALPEQARPAVSAAEEAHRDVRDQVAELLRGRELQPVTPQAAYALPFPVLSAVDAAALGVAVEEGVSGAWVTVLARAVETTTRQLAVGVLGDAEQRAVGWRVQAGRTPVTVAFPGL